MSTLPLARVLIVDDERAQVTALSRTLQAEGYSVMGADSGPRALDMLRAAFESTKAFDVVITDLMMPEMDGIGLLCAARDIDTDLVGIVMTGHGTIDTAVQAMKSGALDYIVKPFNLTVILPVLARALAVRRLRIENTALLRQVTERTTELQAANEELEAFARSVSHDLRSPLNAMIGFADFLIAEKVGTLNTRQKEHLGDIASTGRQLISLTEHLLRLARIGRQSLVTEVVNVNALVREVLDEMHAANPQRIPELFVDNRPDVAADRTLMRQAFANLLSNAFKFTRHTANARIDVGGQREQGEVIYRVRDNGVGFDMRNAESLFVQFRRLHADEKFEGNGLGLSIVQRIILRHGGKISAYGEIGKGACFTISLPMV